MIFDPVILKIAERLSKPGVLDRVRDGLEKGVPVWVMGFSGYTEEQVRAAVEAVKR